MNIVGCDDLGALFLTIVTCVTVGATSVRPQRDRSLRKERPRIRLTIAWEANGLPYGIDVAYEFTYGAPRSYPRAPSLAALPQFTLSHPTIKPVMKYFSLHKIMAGGDSFAIGFSSHRVSGGMHGFSFMLCARTA